MGINVLSLFDGMSCGQIALEKVGVKVDNYYACEIKKHAIKVTQHNFPDTIQLGDVTKLDTKKLPKIDLLIGGPPCQDLSIANRIRKGLDGKKSSLFWEYVRILKEVKPKYFLVENVVMEKKESETISKTLGVAPILIDSSLISGQFRKRNYWTNIKGAGFFGSILLPSKKEISLSSVLEEGYTPLRKARTILANVDGLKTKLKMYHRFTTTGMYSLVFKNFEHYKSCKKHYKENYKGLSGEDIDKKLEKEPIDNSVYEGIRIFTQKEVERLQTVPEGYTSILDRDKAVNLLGDGWTVDVIAHIFGGLKWD